ncbi:MAG: hypothetical protein Q8916_11595 [Bacteroidota bacterium]|nr:hypothetical protein [Bacteroidota bacterium]MDP4231033.1 hypothetical protein [Bacteroidota bacterium]MDP4235708.1 hypothetical protein [Bacteroidota bacterium]
MKKALFLLLLLSATGVAFGFSEVLTYLKGTAGTDAITLDWQSGTETGVKSYSIERSDIKTNDFKEIGSVAATGNNSTYRYRDAAINGAPMNGSTSNHSNMPLSDLYKYRIRLNYDNAVSYSQTITVSRPSAGVKRTWGMIKEMFR